MAQVTEEKIEEVAQKLWADMYERPFRGKDRGRFALTRDQLRHALGVEKLHGSTTIRLQDRCLSKGLVLVDLDDIFPCVETSVVRKYRRPPKAVFNQIFGETADSDPDESLENDQDVDDDDND